MLECINYQVVKQKKNIHNLYISQMQPHHNVSREIANHPHILLFFLCGINHQKMRGVYGGSTAGDAIGDLTSVFFPVEL